jgi:prepilin-type N-terminal cleavage/methylation domain-containing protein
MRTSASCRREPRGFTLLELMVVMAVVGLMAALVAPNLQRLVGSVDRSARRDGLVADIAGLSYRAYSLGESFELSDAGLGRLLHDGNPVLAVPGGWRVTVEQPIQFGFNGLCSGGRLTLRSPDGVVEAMSLRAPDCRIERG